MTVARRPKYSDPFWREPNIPPPHDSVTPETYAALAYMSAAAQLLVSEIGLMMANCGDASVILQDVAKRVGIKSRIVTGYAWGMNMHEPGKVDYVAHSWLVVHGQLFDPKMVARGGEVIYWGHRRASFWVRHLVACMDESRHEWVADAIVRRLGTDWARGL